MPASAPSVEEALRNLKGTPAGYIKAARQVETDDASGLRLLNVAFLSTFTAELVRPYLIVEAAKKGLLLRPYFGPFNQLEQQILDRDSGLYRFEPELVVIAGLLENVAPTLATRSGSLSAAEVEEQLEQISTRFRGLLDGIRQNSTATILVFNLARPRFLAAGLADASAEASQTSVIQRANESIAQTCQKFSGAYVFDYAGLVSETGILRWEDSRLGYMARIPFGAEGQLQLGRRLARYFYAATHPAKKCLVVDLDNTLWGGVLGEDGLEGIALGEDYPGIVYKDFQRRLLSLRDRGILLAVASKNDEDDALNVFQKHPDCLLKATDFASIQVNWGDKATSMRTVAEELNIGLDSLVFFDDNPVEREWVRQQTPEVMVIDVPESALGYASALDESGAFDTLAISKEDRKRPALYETERARRRLQSQSVSLEEFLRQLDMQATVGLVNSQTLSRTSQLLAKTNQFNLTMRRHSAAGIEKMISEGAVALWLRLTDKFGDNGVVGIVIGVPGDCGTWSIDTLLMSCRVLGRQVDATLLNVLSQEITKRKGTCILGEYIPGARNSMVAEFYPSHGFAATDSKPLTWRWDLSNGEIPLPEFVDLRFEDGSLSNR